MEPPQLTSIEGAHRGGDQVDPGSAGGGADKVGGNRCQSGHWPATLGARGRLDRMDGK